MFDEATWAAVAERLKQRALRSVGNVADAQDLAQESMQAALRQDGLSTRADLIGFCLGVLRRQVAAYYRQKRYWRMVPLTATNEPATDIDPSDALVSREATERAAELARHLADADRQLLKLLLSGCPRAQLAGRLGLTRARLRQRCHRLVQKLQRWDRVGLRRLGGVA